MYNIVGGFMAHNAQTIKEIPYGISDYGLIRKGNYYYVDKTLYLKDIEKAGRYLFFIRPRRFGKSLFIAIMAAYYDVFYKDRYREFFEGTDIYENPTGERGEYLVLSLNFSEVSPQPEYMEFSFLQHVRGNIEGFIRKYRALLSPEKTVSDTMKSIKESRTPADALGHLIRIVKESQQKMYIIIDEYDNFSNTLLTTSGEQAYLDLTRGEGFFRSFFNVLKSAATGLDSPVKRLFITGVSPVTLDDVTSGFNIGKNASLNPALNKMLGFTRDDVLEMLEYYKVTETIKLPTTDILDLMTHWYGNYVFSQYRDEKLYNSDMVLYFIDRCLALENFPDNLIDRNVRIDYGKLRHLIILDKNKAPSHGQGSPSHGQGTPSHGQGTPSHGQGTPSHGQGTPSHGAGSPSHVAGAPRHSAETRSNGSPITNGNFSKLKQIIEEDGTTAKIIEGFSLENLTDTDNFISLLFYFGLLTIKGKDKDKLRLAIPNETVKRLYFDYIKEAYRETGVF
ncbi:MAG: AAA family ATPase, partial [bacterium]|nr:AAA family ATPase [bacterium]